MNPSAVEIQQEEESEDDDAIFIYSGEVQQITQQSAHRHVTSATVMGAVDLDPRNAHHLVAFLEQQADTLTQLDITCSLQSEAAAEILSDYFRRTSTLQSVSCCGARRAVVDHLLLACLNRGLANNQSVRSLYCSGFSFQHAGNRRELQELLERKTDFVRIDLILCDFGDDNRSVLLTEGFRAQTQLLELALTCCKLSDAALAAVLETLASSCPHLTKLGLFENFLEEQSSRALCQLLSAKDCRLQEVHLHQSFLHSDERQDALQRVLRYRNLSLFRILVGLGNSNNHQHDELQRYARRNYILAQAQHLHSGNDGNTRQLILPHLAALDPAVGASALFWILLQQQPHALEV